MYKSFICSSSKNRIINEWNVEKKGRHKWYGNNLHYSFVCFRAHFRFLFLSTFVGRFFLSFSILEKSKDLKHARSFGFGRTFNTTKNKTATNMRGYNKIYNDKQQFYKTFDRYSVWVRPFMHCTLAHTHHTQWSKKKRNE